MPRIDINDLCIQLKNLYRIDEKITFDFPQYEKFVSDLRRFIYENHFENTPEWTEISDNLVYKSTESMIREEADIIIIQLEKLHRKLLTQVNEEFWTYVHPLIIAVSQQKFFDGHYADAVESAFKEINSRLKKIYKNTTAKKKMAQN